MSWTDARRVWDINWITIHSVDLRLPWTPHSGETSVPGEVFSMSSERIVGRRCYRLSPWRQLRHQTQVELLLSAGGPAAKPTAPVTPLWDNFTFHSASTLPEESIFFCVKYLLRAFRLFVIYSKPWISYIRLNLTMQTGRQGRENIFILKFQRRKKCRIQNSFGDVKTGKTSLSARINIWINPGFLMQSGALAIPSAERRLLDELSKPQQLKEINWNPPRPSSIFFFYPFKE